MKTFFLLIFLFLVLVNANSQNRKTERYILTSRQTKIKDTLLTIKDRLKVNVSKSYHIYKKTNCNDETFVPNRNTLNQVKSSYCIDLNTLNILNFEKKIKSFSIFNFENENIYLPFSQTENKLIFDLNNLQKGYYYIKLITMENEYYFSSFVH